HGPATGPGGLGMGCAAGWGRASHRAPASGLARPAGRGAAGGASRHTRERAGRMLIIGLMSGTSLDGITAALVDIEGQDVASLRWRMLGWCTLPYEEEKRRTIHDAIVSGTAASLCAV